MASTKSKSSDKPRANKSAKASTKPSRAKSDKPANRSASIKASWNDKATAEARSTKQKVKVDGVEYNSVGDAFRKLKLPVGQHIRFRMELKATASGRKTFETDKGKKHTFVLEKPKAE